MGTCEVLQACRPESSTTYKRSRLWCGRGLYCPQPCHANARNNLSKHGCATYLVKHRRHPTREVLVCAPVRPALRAYEFAKAAHRQNFRGGGVCPPCQTAVRLPNLDGHPRKLRPRASGQTALKRCVFIKRNTYQSDQTDRSCLLMARIHRKIQCSRPVRKEMHLPS